MESSTNSNTPSYLRKAISPAITNGFCTGTIKKITHGEGTRREKKGRDIEEITYERFEIEIDVDTSDKPMQMILHTGTVINEKPVEVINKTRGKKQQKPIYNRLTALCIGLKLLDEDTLSVLTSDDLVEVEKKLLDTKNVRIKFTMGKNQQGFLGVVPHTVELI
jgi:hypothetical protein